MIWQCPECSKQYGLPEWCDDCLISTKAKFSKEDSFQVEAFAKAIDQRVHEVCDLLGYDCHYYDLDEGDSVEVFWEHDSHCSCCSNERGYNTFSFDYLCMTDDEIRQTKAGEKVAAERRAAERKRAEDERRRTYQAHDRLQKAKQRVRTAQTDADRELAQAERDVAALQGREK